MRSISVVWTDDVSFSEIHFGLAALEDIVGDLQRFCFRRGWLQASPSVNVFGNWIIPALPQEAAYRSFQWYIERSYDATRRCVIGAQFLDLVLHEPWQLSNPHYDLALIGQRLLPTRDHSPAQEALALSIPNRATIISVLPLRQIQDERLRLFTIRRVVGHQLGHLLGLPARSRSDSVQDTAGERHCTRVCVMRDARSLDELINLAIEEIKTPTLLCPACQQDLISILADSCFVLN